MSFTPQPFLEVRRQHPKALYYMVQFPPETELPEHTQGWLVWPAVGYDAHIPYYFDSYPAVPIYKPETT